MLTLKSTDMDDLILELRSKKVELAIETVTRVLEGLEQKTDRVELQINSALEMSLFVPSQDYISSLKINFDRLEQAEEYELCKEALKWITEASV
tara:strand:+ start:218 stop:499 length:282 start_codon:yes stop_codon:yes gene_type:complete